MSKSDWTPAPIAYTIVDADGEHFGYGRDANLNVVLTDTARLNADPSVMPKIASGDPGFYTAPFRAVLVRGDATGWFAEL